MDLNIDGLVQDCSNSITNALKLLQSCTKPLICRLQMTAIFSQPQFSMQRVDDNGIKGATL